MRIRKHKSNAGVREKLVVKTEPNWERPRTNAQTPKRSSTPHAVDIEKGPRNHRIHHAICADVAHHPRTDCKPKRRHARQSILPMTIFHVDLLL